MFAEEPVASRGKGKEVTVQVRSGMEAKELGELLKDNGLIDESLLVFEVQYRLSGYYGGIKGVLLKSCQLDSPAGKESNVIIQFNGLDPDLIIVSFGTNEAHGRNYSAEEHRRQLTSFLRN